MRLDHLKRRLEGSAVRARSDLHALVATGDSAPSHGSPARPPSSQSHYPIRFKETPHHAVLLNARMMPVSRKVTVIGGSIEFHRRDLSGLRALSVFTT